MRVFISSTQIDLADYRRSAIDAVRRMTVPMIPIAMEHFKPSERNPVQYCYDEVAAADIFVGIYAFRYGFVPNEKLTYRTLDGTVHAVDGRTSLTNYEYLWATQIGLPLKLFIVDNTVPWLPQHIDPDQSRILAFKQHICESHVVSFISKQEDFALQITRSLMEYNQPQEPRSVLQTPQRMSLATDLQNNEVPIPTQLPAPETALVAPKLSKSQLKAARDSSVLVRLIAGPGTGKTLVIEERVRWLLANGVDPKKVAVVSFTRAASQDLGYRIIRYCERSGIYTASEVNVSTLHSLALNLLRRVNALTDYPSYPQVMDEWELENIFDAEFCDSATKKGSEFSGISKTRAKVIRKAWEAFWCTNTWNPPSYEQPAPEITDLEKDFFQRFLKATTHVYSCVLPGEIVKRCVERLNSGLLQSVATTLGIEHLIVDEYQDLNYTDSEFIRAFIEDGVNVYIAGDDDQSIYSFRFAYPFGIKQFAEYPNVSRHELSECFRCTPTIINAATRLMKSYGAEDRVSKTLVSFCESMEPELSGKLVGWVFGSEIDEMDAIAQSCKTLIERGIKAQNIFVLLGNRKALPPSALERSFAKFNVPVELPATQRYIDSDDGRDEGRLVYSILRIVCDKNREDYIAHRTLLGCQHGVGTSTTNGIRQKVITNNLNYLNVFYEPKCVPDDSVFSTLEKKAVERAVAIVSSVNDWSSEDTLAERAEQISQIIRETLNKSDVATFQDQISVLPAQMNLGELRAFWATRNSEQQKTILESVHNRLDIPISPDGLLPQRVRIMSMHGAKGLNADVVFVPGLEQDIFPGEQHKNTTGSLQEAARLLYVSITRARLACFLSYSTNRTTYGKRKKNKQGANLLSCLPIRIEKRKKGISEQDADSILLSREIFDTHIQSRTSQFK